jgi:hypothetical protein
MSIMFSFQLMIRCREKCQAARAEMSVGHLAVAIELANGLDFQALLAEFFHCHSLSETKLKGNVRVVFWMAILHLLLAVLRFSSAASLAGGDHLDGVGNNFPKHLALPIA